MSQTKAQLIEGLNINTSAPADALVIDSSGNVGVGETTPLGTFHVKSGDSGASSVGASADELVIEGSANSGMTILSGSSEQGLINFADSGDVNIGSVLYDHGSNFMSFKTNDSEQLRIDSSGRLLVGTTSDVSGGLSTTLIQGVAAGGGYVGLARNDASVAADNGIGGLRFYANDPSGYNDVGIVQCVADGPHATDDYPTRLEFHTTADGASSPTERMRIDNAGNVGIGTSSPSVLLHVSSSGDTIARVTSADGNGAFLDLGDASDPDGGRIVYDSGSNLTFSTASTERMRIDSSGNVGVGATSPGTKLDVNDGSANCTIRARTGSGFSSFLHLLPNGSGSGISLAANSDSSAQLFNQLNSHLAVGTNNTERLRIDNSGRLLVGHASSRSVDAQMVVQIEGTTQQGSSMSLVRNSNDAAPPNIVFGKSRGTSTGSNTVVQSGDDLGIIQFFGADGTDANSSAASIKAEVDGTPGSNDMPGRLVFSTTADGASSATERLRIDSSGNVGIGTTSPGESLDVNGKIRSNHASDSRFLLRVNDVNKGGFQATTDDGVVIYGASSTNPIKFQTSGSERARIDTSGRLLVGTSSDVTGSTHHVVQAVTTGGGRITLARNDTSVSAGDVLGQLGFSGNDADGSYQQVASITCEADGTHGDDDKPGRLRFMVTGDGAGSPTERMRIDSAGDLGISITSPSVKLHVAHGTDQNAGTQKDIARFIASTNSPVNSGGLTIGAVWHNTDVNQRIAYLQSEQGLDPGSTARRLSLNPDGGNVGIGTTSPTELLHIAGASNPAITLQDTTNNTDARIKTNNNGDLVFEADYNNEQAATRIGFELDGSERLRIDSSGRVGIGTNSPSSLLHLSGDQTALRIQRTSALGFLYNVGTASTSATRLQAESGPLDLFTNASQPIIFKTNGDNERVRISSGGNLGIGTTSPSRDFHNANGVCLTTGAAPQYRLNGGSGDSNDDDRAIFGLATGNNHFFSGSVAGDTILRTTDGGNLMFGTGTDERMRIDSGGNIYIGRTSDSSSSPGTSLFGSGFARHNRDGNTVMSISRGTNDGNLVIFQRAGTQKGGISVSGNTVTYGAFCGSHWGRLGDSSKPEILPGTILETINQAVEWKVIEFTVDGEQKRQAYNGSEENGASVTVEYEGVSYTGTVADEEPDSEDLNKHVCVKVSDTSASKAVFGVFLGWDDQEELEANNGVLGGWNDMNIAAIGNYFIRIKSGQSLEIGDLIESDGTGCGVVQSDDIIRSKTVGKVTSTTPQQTYADGSFLVTCVLYSG